MSSMDLYGFITGNPRNAEHFEQFLAKVGLTNYYEFVCLVQEIFANDNSGRWGPAIRTLNKNYVDSLPLSDPVRLSIRTKIAREEYPRDIFDEAVKEVWTFLSKEVYKEFIYYVQMSEKSTTTRDAPPPGPGQPSSSTSLSSLSLLKSSKVKKTSPSSSSSSSSASSKDKIFDETKFKTNSSNAPSTSSNVQKSRHRHPKESDHMEKYNCHRITVPMGVSDETQNQSSSGPSDEDPHHDTSPVIDVQKEEGEKAGPSFEGLINRCDNFEVAPPSWPSAKKSDDVKCFAKKLIKKLEHVKQQRDYMAFLTKKLKEQAGDKLSSSDDDDILNEHLKSVWADDSPPPPAKREYKSRDCPANPYHTKHPIPKSQTFPAPSSSSSSRCDPDSGISVVSMSTASTSRSVKTDEFSECSSSANGPCGSNGRKLHHGAAGSSGSNGGGGQAKSSSSKGRWSWKKVKEIPVVVQYHGNAVPFSFGIPAATEKITLRVFKKYLPQKGNFRYLFQYSGRHGVGTEEIFEDTSEIPILHGKIVATIKPFF